MENIKNQSEENEFKKLKDRIKMRIKSKNAVNLSELRKLGKSRNAVIYHIRRLYEAKEIHAFIIGNGLDDDGLFYSMMPTNYPIEIHEIKKLINKMCEEKIDTAAPAYEEFINLCVKKGVFQRTAERLAMALICKALPDLNEKVTYHLMIGGNEGREIIDAAYAKGGQPDAPVSRFDRLLEGL